MLSCCANLAPPFIENETLKTLKLSDIEIQCLVNVKYLVHLRSIRLSRNLISTYGFWNI